MAVKAGFVGLIGPSNAGKSTLVNAMVGEKVSIVSRKPQTTRNRVVGVYSEKQLQVLFVDAPGAVHGASGLNYFLEQEYKDVVAESDMLVAVLNVDENNKETLDNIVKTANHSGKPWIAFINKADLAHNQRVLRLQRELQDIPVLTGSALKSPEAIQNDLLDCIRERLPSVGDYLYDPDLYTLSNVRDMAAEIVREKLFEHLHYEVPYNTAVRVKQFDEEDTITRIYADILTAKPTHRQMVIGRGGRQLKAIGKDARQDLEELLGTQVYLDLHVSLRKKWPANKRLMEELGYVVPAAR